MKKYSYIRETYIETLDVTDLEWERENLELEDSDNDDRYLKLSL